MKRDSAMSFRAFISIDVEPSERMRRFHEALKGTGAPLKLVKLENIHLTLKFLGNTEENLVPKIVEVMEGSLTGLEPFTIHFLGTGAFPSLGHMKVVWVGVCNVEKVVSIAGYLNDELARIGFRKEKREFSPHLTLGRVKGGRHKERLARVIRSWSEEDFGTLEVDGIRLKKSVLSPHGPIYSTVHETTMKTL